MIKELSREVIFKIGCDRRLIRSHLCETQGKRSASEVKNQHKGVFERQKVAVARVSGMAFFKAGLYRATFVRLQ